MKAMTAQVTTEEIHWVQDHLSKEECEWFLKLKVYEQRHCIDVAHLLNDWSHGQNEMIRLGLLHDIGKSVYPLNPIEKSLIVVLDYLSKGKIQKYQKLKMVKCYYQHGELGYHILKQLGIEEQCFLEQVRNHHQNHSKDQRIQLLQKADNQC